MCIYVCVRVCTCVCLCMHVCVVCVYVSTVLVWLTRPSSLTCRHHTFKKVNGKDVELKEVGPRFEMKRKSTKQKLYECMLCLEVIFPALCPNMVRSGNATKSQHHCVYFKQIG